jgi:prolipoprotein diacylglyceryltransferase
MGYALYRGSPASRSAMADVLVAGLVAGIVLARAIHVILNWAHFAYHTDEIIQLTAGGLDWHGALWGALIAIRLAGRWRQIDLPQLIDSLTAAIPLITFAAWWGCWSVGCSYGQEVETLADYPAFLVWEGPDIFGIYAPRFNTNLLGIVAGAALFVIAVVLFWHGWLPHRRFWLLLSLHSLSMFALGFLRGDYAVYLAGLRADQWLDLAILLMALILTFRPANRLQSK